MNQKASGNRGLFFPADCRAGGRKPDLDGVAMRTTKSRAGKVAAMKPRRRAGAWNHEPAMLVCAGLALALVALALRIASLW